MTSSWSRSLVVVRLGWSTDLGAHPGELAAGLGEAAVVTDRQPDAAEVRDVERREAVARRARLVRLPREHLAVARHQLTVAARARGRCCGRDRPRRARTPIPGTSHRPFARAISPSSSVSGPGTSTARSAGVAVVRLERPAAGPAGAAPGASRAGRWARRSRARGRRARPAAAASPPDRRTTGEVWSAAIESSRTYDPIACWNASVTVLAQLASEHRLEAAVRRELLAREDQLALRERGIALPRGSP